MKYLLTLLLCMGLIACSSSDEPSDPNPGPNPGPVDPQPEPEPELPLGVDPSYQQDHVKLDQFGLPVGECVNIGETWSWERSAAHKDMRVCSSEKLGEACSGRDYCKINNIQGLSCKKETTYRCHGWVFKRQDPQGGGLPSFEMLEDAKVYNFNFMGSESSRTSQIVDTDENGYFEFESKDLGNQVRSEKSGYYSACAMSSPFPFAGATYKRHQDQVDVYPLVLKVLDASVDCTK